MVLLEGRRDPLQSEQRLVGRELGDLDGRHAAREPGIAEDDALVVLDGGCAHARQLSTRQCGLQLGGNLLVAREHRVQLVEEKDDASLRARDLGLDLRDALGQGPPDTGAGEQGGGVDLDDDAIVEGGDLLSVRDALRETAHDAGLADAGGADEARAVGVPLGEDVERAVDLGLASEDGVQLAAGGGEGEVLAEGSQGREALRVELEGREGWARGGGEGVAVALRADGRDPGSRVGARGGGRGRRRGSVRRRGCRNVSGCLGARGGRK